MLTTRKILACISVALLVAACSKEGAEDATVPTSATATQQVPEAPPEPALPAEPGPDALLPTAVATDAVTVGSALQGDKVVKAASPQFTVADTVHAGSSVKGRPAGAEVAVYWTYEDGRTHKEERRPLAQGEQYVSFSFAKADGMKPGKYNAQIDVNMVPIGITDFVVK